MSDAHWSESEKTDLMKWIGAQEERDRRLEERDLALDRTLTRLSETVEGTNGKAVKALSRVNFLYWLGGVLLALAPFALAALRHHFE